MIYLENSTGKRYTVAVPGQVEADLGAPEYLGLWSDWLRRAVYFEEHPYACTTDWPTIVATVPPVCREEDGSLTCGEWRLYEGARTSRPRTT